jgi:hypothetical protein
MLFVPYVRLVYTDCYKSSSGQKIVPTLIFQRTMIDPIGFIQWFVIANCLVWKPEGFCLATAC